MLWNDMILQKPPGFYGQILEMAEQVSTVSKKIFSKGVIPFPGFGVSIVSPVF
jgi:hypothetical protein